MTGFVDADLHHERVDQHDQVALVDRPVLPGANVVEDRVGHVRDEVLRHGHAVDLFEVAADPGKQ
jgi:hypothetical protein